ncbi:hypothetical protein I5677_07575 [Mobilitalea sibirica]|uniref:ABC-transporter type IV n=1 Tax=Mobilitalea sibirica TaxID=1462919 RepID=A0A8J7KZQ8_9FIRM|nr:hypothetical protein [Mobilitalea sibirica]MBH1940743.1 hypothetical protein [Mobilitalea sibirica]
MLIRNNRFFKYLILFLIGGFVYGGVEILSRGYSHISMLIAGGISFICIGQLNEGYSWRLSLVSQMVISAGIITLIEFISGLIVNVWLGLGVWDYSDKPYNILGQVCLLYTNFWFFLSLPGILLDDYLRYYLLGEEKPQYKIF